MPVMGDNDTFCIRHPAKKRAPFQNLELKLTVGHVCSNLILANVFIPLVTALKG